MSRTKKDPLRPLTSPERRSLEQLARSQSAPALSVARARALLAVSGGSSTGQVRVKGVTSCPNVVLHAWLEAELLAILESLPPPVKILPEDDNRAAWEHWQAGLTVKPTLCETLPSLRLLLIMDNLAGHLTASFVVWLFETASCRCTHR